MHFPSYNVKLSLQDKQNYEFKAQFKQELEHKEHDDI
jgi:hypothetical protein